MEHLGEASANLEETFGRLWARVRSARLYGGRPRNVSSEESLDVARQALSIAAKADVLRYLAEAKSMMAYALNANEECAESLAYYREAIQVFEQTGDFHRASRVRLGFITALALTGQTREALEAGEEAGRVFRQEQDLDGLARLASNLGSVYQRLDDNEHAAEQHFQAAELFKRIGDEGALAQVYLNLGNTLCFLSRFSESGQMYSECEALSVRLGIEALRSQALYNRAYLYFMTGRFSQALSVYRDARQMFVKSGSRRHAALCDLDEAEIYVQLRLPQDALALAQAAAQSFLELDMSYEAAKAIAFGGVALTQQRKFGDALTAFREAQGLMQQGGNAFWAALLELYRAEVLFSIGRLWEAHAMASESAAKFSQLGHPAKRLVSMVLLGRISLELGRLDEAQLQARTAQDLAVQLETSAFVFACQALSAEIAEREGRLDAALQAYERGVQEIEFRHTHFHHAELGIAFYKDEAAVFESLAHLTLSLEGADAPLRAYSWCEKAKSQMFVDALAPHLPSVRSRADEALLARVDRIRAELNGSYLRFRPEFLTTPGLPQAGRTAFKEDELIRTLSELSKSDSEYVSLQSASSVPIGDLQRALPDDSSLIEYYFVRDEVLAFVVTKDNFEVVRHLTPTKRVQYLAGRLQQQMSKFETAVEHGKCRDSALKAAADQVFGQFYDELLAAVLPLVRTRRLIIVPHGLLHRIPFHAFHDGEAYLADRFDISYAPSGSVLKHCLERAPVDEAAPFLVAPGAHSTTIRTGIKAGFIRIDVPAALRRDNPVFSGLEMADGIFCIPDIYATNLETNLLSVACGDSVPDLSGNGDNLLGLQRSLLYAGARSVLLELWRIRPEPSGRFLTSFYKEWLAGQSKSEAMRLARESMLAEFPHPLDWAPFVLIGQP